MTSDTQTIHSPTKDELSDWIQNSFDNEWYRHSESSIGTGQYHFVSIYVGTATPRQSLMLHFGGKFARLNDITENETYQSVEDAKKAADNLIDKLERTSAFV